MSFWGHVLPLMLLSFFLGMALVERKWRRSLESQSKRLDLFGAKLGGGPLPDMDYTLEPHERGF